MGFFEKKALLVLSFSTMQSRACFTWCCDAFHRNFCSVDYRNFCSVGYRNVCSLTKEISGIHTTEIAVKSSAKAEESSLRCEKSSSQLKIIWLFFGAFGSQFREILCKILKLNERIYIKASFRALHLAKIISISLGTIYKTEKMCPCLLAKPKTTGPTNNVFVTSKKWNHESTNPVFTNLKCCKMYKVLL